MKIDFSPPDITEAEIAAVTEVLRSGWITTGERVRQLEERLADFCGSAGVVCMGSGTAALEMTLRLLEIGPGDEVITTAYTYSATAAAICHVGARPVLCDLPESGYLLTAADIEPLITPRTRAVIPVDFAGMPCDYRAIKEMLWHKYTQFYPHNAIQSALGRVAIIADAAHSLGASREGVPVGALADFTCLSFHAVKNVTTAEGGAVCWRDIPGIPSNDIRGRLMRLSLHGQTKTALEKQAWGWEYDILFPGYKCNMTDMAAALGLAQLERYPELLLRRRQLVLFYNRALEGFDLILPQHGITGDVLSSCHLYPVGLPSYTEAARNAVIEGLADEGVAANVHYKPLPMLTAYREMGFDIRDYPTAHRCYAGEITLPLHSRMDLAQVVYTAENLIVHAAGRGLLSGAYHPAADDRQIIIDGEQT